LKFTIYSAFGGSAYKQPISSFSALSGLAGNSTGSGISGISIIGGNASIH